MAGAFGKKVAQHLQRKKVSGDRLMEKYEQLSVVGEGSYGLVMKCRHRESNQLVAIKKFLETEEDATVRRMALREIRMLKRLRHENLVTMIDVFRHRKRFYLVFEFMEGTILDELERNPEGLGEESCRERVFQVTRAVQYCHANNIIHRDVKPENVLVSSRGVVKLCDFGFARILGNQNDQYTEYVATRWYRAPELLVGDLHYGQAVDIWSIGCLYSEMMTGEPLFPGESDIDQLFLIVKMFGKPCSRHQQLMSKNPSLRAIKRVASMETKNIYKVFQNWSLYSLDFLNYCMKMDPNIRPTADELLKHNFFTHDRFVEHYLPELREKVRREFTDNPLLRKFKLDFLYNDMGKKKELKSKRSAALLEPPKWKINLIHEPVKRKFSSDFSNENSMDSKSLLSFTQYGGTGNKYSQAQKMTQYPRNTTLQSIKRDDKQSITEPNLIKFGGPDVRSGGVGQIGSDFFHDTSESAKSTKLYGQNNDNPRLDKALVLLSRLNTRKVFRPKSTNKDTSLISSNLSPSPPDFQSLQSHSFRESLNIKSPAINGSVHHAVNIHPKKSPYVIQNISNASLKTLFPHQLPITNPPRSKFKKLERSVCVDVSVNNIDKSGRFKSPPEWLNNIGISQSKKEKKGKNLNEFSLPILPGATASPSKPKKKLTPESNVTENKIATPKIVSPNSYKSTPSKINNNKHLPFM